MTDSQSGIKALTKLRTDTMTGDPSEDLSFELRTANIEKFPYVNDVSLLTDEVKNILTVRAETLKVIPEELFAAAVSHPATWTFLVLLDGETSDL